MLFVLFGLFIFPVVYCYYLQFNLHPEKIVRGKDHINGIKFILFNQSVERFSGGMLDESTKYSRSGSSVANDFHGDFMRPPESLGRTRSAEE